MKKEDFTLLLTDLYTAYNPDYIEYIPQLIQRYSRMEFSAIDMVLLKYNRKNSSHYDANKDTDEYKHFLIKEYSEGRRPLKDFKIENEINTKKEEADSKFQKESQKIEENVTKKIQELQDDFAGKEKELIKAYEGKIEELTKRLTDIQPVKSGPFDGIDIKIICNYTEHELKFPNKESLASLGVGTRIVTSSVDGSKMIGLKIMDIMYDCVSDFNGKPIIEIIIDKE